MGLLRTAFNSLTGIHSRAAVLKRLGTATYYSPIRITPANYFRFLEGQSSTVIRGREFIIPVDTMLGHATASVSFSAVPTTGSFFFSYGGNDTTALDETATAASIQTALRLLAGLENVTVSGSYAAGLTIVMIGVETPTPLTATLTPADELDATITIEEGLYTVWSPIIKRGDKIIDATLGHMAIDEIIEMPDLGSTIMGYRVRAE